MKYLRVFCFTAVAFATGTAFGVTMSVSNQMSIKIFNPPSVAFSPASPSVACNVAPGTNIATATVSGGDNNPITADPLMGDTGDFALGPPINGNSWPILIGPNGIAPANCPVPPATIATQTVIFTATQP